MFSSLLRTKATALVRPAAARMMVANQQRFATAAAPTTGTVNDILVNITIVDPSGARKKIKGIIGKTLYEACELQGVELGAAGGGGLWETKRSETWSEPTFGESATVGFDHVVLTGKGATTSEVEMSRPEQHALEDYWDGKELYEGSRLASCVVVNKEMDGMVVYVPDRVDDCIY
eukprot:CAMPEP_0168759164 /NCGR_PEP_ID=MMETSP0724-20121128/22078_1 /TAXON_ID=265536 /ORGANISM="Amphiprora sp., Strain CCMP467" /LENGTH=174 /DNA_ID=CAMNT_0008808071 /DNA_START=57 /DNA_END=581 /DNA_ORIENTATION=+